MLDESTAQPVRRRLAAVAAGWWLAYSLVAVSWCFGGQGWPYAADSDATQAGALLVGLDAGTAGPVVVAFGLAAAAVSLMVGRRQVRFRRVVICLGWLVSALPVLIVPDARLLLTVFQILTGNSSGIGWSVLHQVVSIAGGLLTAAAIVRAAPAKSRGVVTTSPTWARMAIGAAIVAPLGYAAIRWSWAAGIPLGATPEFFAPYQVAGARVTEAVLGAMSAGGALLTVGLIRPWGEAVPRWVPVLAGRRVHPLLAVVPATAVAALLTTAGLSLTRGLVAMAVGLMPATAVASLPNWGGWVAAPLWLVWGIALGAATVAYHRRRRAHQDLGVGLSHC
jgi:hypothetical protein